MSKKRPLSEFQRALLNASLEDFSDVPEEGDIDLIPSPKFQAEAAALIRHTQRPHWRYMNTTLKRAIIIAAVIAMLATSVMAIPALREAVINFLFPDHITHYGITFEPDEAANAPEAILQVYGPTHIPEGYELAIEDVSAAGVAFWYVNAQDQWICFTQYVLPPDPTDDTWFGVNAEQAERQSLLVGDYLVEEIQSKSVYFWFWTDNQYLYSLEISNGTPREIAEQVLRSVVLLYEL